MARRMKLPNQYGSITKLSGRRRNPYVVRVTVGWNDDGTQIRKAYGYYPDYKTATEALVGYHKNPTSINSDATFQECYDKWSEEKFERVKDPRGYKAAYNFCKSIYKVKMRDIRLCHLEDLVAKSGAEYPTLKNIKSLLKQVFEYAVKHDIISNDANKVQFLDISRTREQVQIANANKLHSAFTPAEVKRLWSFADANVHVAEILMLVYSGVRVSELLDLKKEHVHLDEQYFEVVDSKTQAGIRRVPIADKVLPFYKNRYAASKIEYLLTTESGGHMKYYTYRECYWDPLMELLGMKHLPHDTRHTCISLLNTAEVNPTTIKMIVGHAGKMDLTERVYTHKMMDELLEAINQI